MNQNEEETRRGLIQTQSKLGADSTVDPNHFSGGTGRSTPDEQRKKKIKWIIIGVVGGIAVLLAILLPILLIKKDNPTPTPPLDYYNPYTLDPKDIQVFPARTTGILRAKQGYNPEHHCHAFNRLFSKLKTDEKKSVNTQQIPQSKNNPFVQNLNFTFSQVQWRVSHLVIKDADNTRFSIPEVAVPNPADNLDMRLDMTGFKMNTEGTFGFSFSDPLFADNKFLDTTECSLLFMDKFIQMDFNLPSQRLFGFGERIHEFALKEGAWNMWAHGQPSPYDDGSGRKGEYGVHPFLLVGSQHTDDFYGMYIRNANAMTPIITFNDDGTSKLSFITVGGQIEIFFFIHGSAQDVIKKYQEFMGARPKLPPFWALGWMQTSYAWKNQQMVTDAVGQYRTQGFPLDAIFLDIPYMDNYVDFTVDKKNFPNIGALADDLHAHDQHLIPIIDAAISAEDLSNPYYSQGNKDDIFIKSSMYKSEKYNNNLVNQVWPKVAVFVDWFNDKCTNMWFMGLDHLYNETKYDGIWIDMNEPWGFETAELDPNNIKGEKQKVMQQKGRFLESQGEKNYDWYASFNSDKESTYDLPFIPDFENYKSYDNNTISLNATNPSMNTSQYNLHDFYGHMMAKRTSQYFNQLNDTDPRKDKRSFVLTRSTFTSTGQYASHWLGDNYREYRFMNYSIAGIMNFNMFGIHHVGADVCGFFGSARNDKLCAKWSQLATFYPFARFHYDIDSPPNEPYLMEEPYHSIAKRTMFDRYQYMRALYTCLFEVSKNGGTCFDPQFYYFPSDANTYNEIESTFIFAGAIKITPSLTDSTQNTTPSYFPDAKGPWAALHNLGELIAGNGTVNLDITTQSVNAHLMPGKVIAFQNNSDMHINKIKDLINAPISLVVNLDNNGYAKGSLFLDQGEQVSELNNWNYEYYNFHVSQKSIQVQFQEGHRGSQAGYNLDSIKFLNGGSLKDNNIACYLSISNKLQPVLLNHDFIDSENAYVITAGDEPVRFHDIHSIHIAAKDELNVCSPDHFRYTIRGGVVPELRKKSQVIMRLDPLNNKLPPVIATLSILQGGILNLKWKWEANSVTGKQPFEVPDEYISTNDKPLFGDLSKYVAISANPFQVSFLYDDASQSQFFRMDGMIYHDYLNWIKVQAYTESGDKFKGVFGLGERANFDFFYKDGVYSMWSKDIPTPIETGDLPASNMYGTHPYFMYKHKSNAWVGVLYKLAAAQDWWIQNSPADGRVSIQTVAVGGVADIYIMMGANPEQITQKYYSLIGYPVLIPQWGLGWNQCRYGYRDVATLQSVLSGYRDNGFPLDVMWSDIDYMQNYRNFLYDDQIAFKGLPDFIQHVHDLGLKYVPILDAGTAARPLAEENYPEYLEGEKDGVFMTINGETFIGQVWPNDAAFPDFFAPAGISWWQDNLSKMHDKIQFDGLWLDMNEASNFCVGACYQRQVPAKPVKTMLKYIPTGRDLEVQSMPLDTKHTNGNISLDTHSLYGIQEIKVTHEWFQNVRKERTFIIERSSFAGMGKWASRWLGDNFSEEKFMKLSVSGVMLMSMFGIPVSGADICGFLGNTNENLCIKWHFVGAFYPFSRNHNGGQVAQEPYVWSKPAQAAMKDAIRLKYSLVRYYYTSLFDISTKGTGTFYKPLFFEFPEDNKAFASIEYNPMLGSALKLSMNPESLTQKTTDFYFPAGLWCKLKGNTLGENCFTSKGQTKNYPSDLSDYQVHLREGYVVPMQDTSAGGFNTTQDLMNWPVDFHALGSALSVGGGQWSASGRYVNDDGVTLNLEGNVNSYTLYANYDGVSSISVLIGMDKQATNKNVQDDGCISVNKNDYLGSLSFYNAKGYGLDSANGFDVLITLKPDNKVTKYQTVYDTNNDRLVFQMTSGTEICMSRIVNIKINKKA